MPNTDIKKTTDEKLLAIRILKEVNRIGSTMLTRKDIGWRDVDNLLERFGNLLDVAVSFIFERVETHNDKDPCYLQLFKGWGKSRGHILELNDLKKIQCYNVGKEDAIYGDWYNILESGEPVFGLIDEFNEKQQILLSKYHIDSIALVPIFLINGEKTFWGIVGFGCDCSKIWSDIEIEALHSFSNLVSLVIQNIKNTESKNQKIDELIKTILTLNKAQDKELSRVRLINKKLMVGVGLMGENAATEGFSNGQRT